MSDERIGGQPMSLKDIVKNLPRLSDSDLRKLLAPLVASAQKKEADALVYQTEEYVRAYAFPGKYPDERKAKGISPITVEEWRGIAGRVDQAIAKFPPTQLLKAWSRTIQLEDGDLPTDAQGVPDLMKVAIALGLVDKRNIRRDGRALVVFLGVGYQTSNAALVLTEEPVTIKNKESANAFLQIGKSEGLLPFDDKEELLNLMIKEAARRQAAEERLKQPFN